MATVSSTLDGVYAYQGSLLNLSGSLVVSAFTAEPAGTFTFEDQDGDHAFDPAEAGTWNGDSASYLGSGTATVGVDLLGLQIDLSSSVPVDAFTAGGETHFYYPEGQPAELLNGLAEEVLANPLSGPALSLLGITGQDSLLNYLEQNALLTFDLNASGGMVVCFTRGTLITTADGAVPVENLAVGDLVQTVDNGLQPIRWKGTRRVPALGSFAPIRFAAGAVGNDQVLEVSPQHRMLVTGWRAELFFGSSEVLTPAKHLVNGGSIRRRCGGWVEYHHILFDDHELVFANGAPSESFHIGATGLSALTQDCAEELFALFPELEQGTLPQTPARPVLRHREARLLQA